jgi:hypothetical protein
MKSMEIAKKFLDGEQVEAVNIVPLDVVTKENVASFTTPEW